MDKQYFDEINAAFQKPLVKKLENIPGLHYVNQQFHRKESPTFHAPNFIIFNFFYSRFYQVVHRGGMLISKVDSPLDLRSCIVHC